MKKFLLLILLVAGLGSPLFAQSNVQTTQLQARWTGVTVADGKKCVKPGSYPITSHNFVFTVRKDTGTVSAILVTVTGSTDGTDPPVTSLATSTNTAGATITPTAAPYTNLCIALTSITGTGSPVIDVTYSGAAVGSGGAVTVGGTVATTATDGAIATLGTTTDAKCTTSDATACTAVALLKELAGLAATDPCAGANKTTAAISITTATTTRIIAPSASNKVYVCFLNIGPIEAVADNLALVEGTGGTCGSGTAAIIGGTTAAKGWNLAASQGLALGSGGATIFKTAGTNVDVCIISDSAAEVPGVISYILAP
jgi:hypothetical protein